MVIERVSKVISVFFFNTLLIIFIVAPVGSSFAGPVNLRNNPDGSQTIGGHVPLEARNPATKFLSHALASQNLSVRIILPLSNQTQLSSLLQDIYDPKSPNYHNFLTPDQFAQKFAPSSTRKSGHKEEMVLV